MYVGRASLGLTAHDQPSRGATGNPELPVLRTYEKSEAEEKGCIDAYQAKPGGGRFIHAELKISHSKRNTDMPNSRIGWASIESKTHGNVLWVALDHGRTRIGFSLNPELYRK